MKKEAEDLEKELAELQVWTAAMGVDGDLVVLKMQVMQHGKFARKGAVQNKEAADPEKERYSGGRSRRRRRS